MDEVIDPVTSFKNFNEFFYRKLKPEVRPIYERENPVLVNNDVTNVTYFSYKIL
jgi:phosphatidylserine decarboxylase